MQGRRTQGLYIISVAAQILDMHPQTLRKYERAGFIEPPRLGTLRLYSEHDIAQLRLIKYLVEDLGLNLAGIELALKLTKRLLATRESVDHADASAAQKERTIAALDRILFDLGIIVNKDEPREGASRRDHPTRITVR
ncbi:MAG: MerR family transcriptional regulator [Dehalococcoidia bacterium]|nr:MerR family transcriptional regulator [Dehalococcoidia bacterium]